MTSTTAARPATTSESAARADRTAWAARSVQVVAAIHLLALALVLTHLSTIEEAVRRDNVTWSLDRVHQISRQLWISVAVPHLLFAVIFFVRARKLLSGGRRARMIVTVLLGVQLAGRLSLPYQLALLPGQGALLLTVQSVSLVFELTALWLLWRR